MMINNNSVQTPYSLTPGKVAQRKGDHIMELITVKSEGSILMEDMKSNIELHSKIIKSIWARVKWKDYTSKTMLERKQTKKWQIVK